MLPRTLHFKLKPRLPRPWLQALCAGVAAALVVFVGAVIWMRENNLALLRQGVSQERQALFEAKMPRGAAATAPPVWQDEADDARRMLQLTIEPRLVAIERCTNDRMVVRRLVHDGKADSTYFEASMEASQDLPELLSCLNAGEVEQPWALVNIQADLSKTGTTAVLALLRRNK